jgi:hypothetical protein
VLVTIREGRWRCPRCNRSNLGRDLQCQGCGDPRGDDVKFYLPEDAPEVTDGRLLAQAKAGADRLCEFCDAANPPDAKVCSGCGAPLTERQRQDVFHPDQSAPVAAQPLVASALPPPAIPDRAPGLSRGAKLGGLGCLVALLMAGAAFVVGSLWQHEATLTVTGVSWQRSIDTERRVTVRKTGWQGELPAGARSLSSRQAQRSTRQVKVGTERVKVGTKDLGNGFFEDVYEERPVTRAEPVYGTEVTYEVDEWQFARTAREEGADFEPHWPLLEPGERERSGTRKEVCRVFLSGPRGKRLSAVVKGADFGRYTVGSRHRAKVDAFGAVHGLK